MESIITHVSASVLGAAFLMLAVLTFSLALAHAPQPKRRPVRVAHRRAAPAAKR